MLKKFYELTLFVSGSFYVTSNIHVDEISNVLVGLKNCQSDDLNMRSSAVKIREKYDKYLESWENMNMLTYNAVLLDPRNNEVFYGHRRVE